MSESILVVRSGALGDTILTLPLLETLKERHPAAEITFLGARAYLDLVPPGVAGEAFDSPHWLWLFEDNLVEMGRSSRVWDYAYVVLNRPATVIRSLSAAGTGRIAAVSPAPREGVHVVAAMHHGLGLPVPPKRPALSHIAPQRPKRDVIWVHPGSGGPKKCAPLDVVAARAEEASRKTGLPVVMTIGEADGFLKDLNGWDRLVGLASAVYEERPLGEICSKLGGAGLFIGNDSGMSHLAAGLGVKSNVFFVATDPVQWAPWVPDHQITVMTPSPDGWESTAGLASSGTRSQSVMTLENCD